MKAKDYVKKYWTEFSSNNPEIIGSAATSLVGELFSEGIEIATKRKVKTPSSTVAIYKELNNKWNAISTQLEQSFDYPILQRDGFLKVAQSQLGILFELAEVERLKKVMPALNTTEAKE